MIVCNVIIPAMALTYAISLAAPVFFLFILLLEGGAVRLIEPKARTGVLCVILVAANVWSWILGVVLMSTSLFPTGWVNVDGRLTPGPHFQLLVALGVVVAWLLSIVAELAVFVPLRKRAGIQRPARAAVVANSTSYVSIGLFFLATAL